MSLFNIDQIPEKELTTALRCKICNGLMQELPKSFSSKLIGVFNSNLKNAKRFQCEECKKELYIRET